MTDMSSMHMPFSQKCIVTLWPSFMIAIVATGLFFSAFEPRELYPFDLDMEINAVGAYTLGFFIFWFLSATSSMMTLYFTITNFKKLNAEQSND